MHATTGMSTAETKERLESVMRVHQALNARRQLEPMREDMQAMWFMAGSFAVLCLVGIATLL